MSSLIRINKLLSQLGIASRRKADQLIREGAVALNGQVLKVAGAMVDIARDRVAVRGEGIDLGKQRRCLYFMLNKPKGYISTVRDTHQRRTVMELVPANKGLFPVGRLDKDTTGLILITNDGELANRLMHPRYEVKKVYEVEIRGHLNNETIPNCKVLEVKRIKGATKVLLEIHEGKKRQIRRAFESLGYRINSLKRISYAGLKLDIKEGSYRKLTNTEVSHLKSKCHI